MTPNTYTVRYGRVFNLGNYESERIELEMEFENTVTHTEAIAYLRGEIEKEYRGGGKKA